MCVFIRVINIWEDSGIKTLVFELKFAVYIHVLQLTLDCVL